MMEMLSGIIRRINTTKEKIIKVYPNPSKDCVCLEYFLPGDKEDVILSIKNIRCIETTRFCLPDKKGIKVWDARGLKPGVYIYTLKAAGFIKSGKIVINK